MKGLVKDTPRTGNFVMDWLEFTYRPSCKNLECDLWSDFVEDFPEFESYIEHLVMLERGFIGYSSVLAYGTDFKIMYHADRPDMGVHVQFPSSGMHKLAEIFKLEGTTDFVSVAPLFKKLKERECKISRLDLCYDDFDYRNHFTPHDFGYFAMTKRISTSTNKMQFISSTQTKGATFYLGARGGERYLRIYDKNYESKGVIDSVRYELQLKGAQANAIFNHVADGKQFCFADLLSNMFNVVNEYDLDDSDVSSSAMRMRKKNAGILKEWDEFLDTIRKIPILNASDIVVDRVKRQSSLDKSLQWFKKYVVPSLYLLKEVYGGDLILQEIDEAEDRLNKQQEALLMAYRKECLRDFSV